MHIWSGSTATGVLFPIVHIWMRVRMRIRVAQLDIVCRTRVQYMEKIQDLVYYQYQYERNIVPCLHKGSGAVSYLGRQLVRGAQCCPVQYLADLVCPNGLGLRDGTHSSSLGKALLPPSGDIGGGSFPLGDQHPSSRHPQLRKLITIRALFHHIAHRVIFLFARWVEILIDWVHREFPGSVTLLSG